MFKIFEVRFSSVKRIKRRYVRNVVAYVVSGRFEVSALRSLQILHHDFLRAFCGRLVLLHNIHSVAGIYDLVKFDFGFREAYIRVEQINELVESKDFQLLLGLYGNAHQSYQSLGRRVSLSAPAVRDRLNRLRSKGILQGFILVIDSSVFDRDDLLLFFHGNFSRKSVLAAFAAPDVSWVAWKVDGRIILSLWTKNEREATDNVSKILGVRPYEGALKPRKKRRAPLSITDLLIMDALVDDPKIPFGELLKSTGLSPKTVRKHLNRLLETKTISIDPILGALTDSSTLIYHMVVAGRVNMDEVRRIMGDSAQTHHTLEPPMKHVLCRADSLAEVITKTRELENVQGVKYVTILLNRETLVSTDLRRSLIREEIRKLEKVQVA